MNSKILSTMILSLLAQSSYGLLGFHTCLQGHKCVYYRGGKLLNETNEPGFHMMMPLITSNYNVQTFSHLFFPFAQFDHHEKRAQHTVDKYLTANSLNKKCICKMH